METSTAGTHMLLILSEGRHDGGESVTVLADSFTGRENVMELLEPPVS